MYESSYSLVNTDYVNVKSGDKVTTLNKNLKYNPAKNYEDLYTRTANLFNALSTDTIEDIEIVTKKSLSQKVDIVQLYTINGELIPDNKFDWYKTDSIKRVEFSLENPNVPLPTLGVYDILKGSYNPNHIGLTSITKFVQNNRYCYQVKLNKIVDLEAGSIYRVQCWLDFAVNAKIFTIQLEIKE